MGLLIGALIVAAVIVIGGIVGLSLKGREGKTTNTLEPGKAQRLLPDQAKSLDDARRVIVDARMAASRVQQEEVRQAALEVLKKAEDINAAIKKQPDEIRRASQYFNYYLPTLSEILKRYESLEKSGVDLEDSTEKAIAYLGDVSTAFDHQYQNLFNDEKFDLDVDVESMQLILKRDGMI